MKRRRCINGTKCHGKLRCFVSRPFFCLVWSRGTTLRSSSCADNCGGQNKNRTVISYCAWTVIRGLHQGITLSFIVAGHQCLIDGHFGLVKRRDRRSDIGSLTQPASPVEASAATNVAHIVNGDAVWREWDAFFKGLFGTVPQIQKQQHFRFSADSPAS